MVEAVRGKSGRAVLKSVEQNTSIVAMGLHHRSRFGVSPNDILINCPLSYVTAGPV